MASTVSGFHRAPGLIGAIVVCSLAAAPRELAAATTYKWAVPSGPWSAAASWSPPRSAPAADDILVFEGALTPVPVVTDLPHLESIGQLRVTANAFVTINNSGVDTVSIAGGAGDDFVVEAGSTFGVNAPLGEVIAFVLLPGATGRVSGQFTAAGGVHRLLPADPGSLVFDGGSRCRTLTGFAGNLFGNAGATSVVVFRLGSIYEHNSGLHPFGLTAPASRVVFETGSLVRYLATSGNGAFGGRVYADCEIGPGTGAPTVIGGSPLPVTFDHLSIFSGGFRNQSGSALYQIRGDLRVHSPGFFEQTPPAGPATVRFDGAGAQTIGGTGTILLGTASVLEVANVAGVALQRDLFAEGTVALSSSHLNTDVHTLRLGQVATVTGPNWVIGNLGRIIPASAGNVTRTFEVGDAQHGTPVTVSFASVQDSGTVVVRTDPGDHAAIASSGLDAARGVDRWWSVRNLGVSFTTCDVTLNFDPDDMDAGADPDAFAVGRHDGAAWSLPLVGTRTATSTQALSLTALGDFVVAEEEGAVDVGGPLASPTALAAARPSPFRERTVLEYALAAGGAIELAVFGVDGRRVRTLERGERSAGAHRVVWDGRDDGGRGVATGIYFVRLAAPQGRFERKVIRVRY